jgi:SAM-dependent methyltransferase
VIPLPAFLPIAPMTVLPTATGLRGIVKDNGALITLAALGGLALAAQVKTRRERRLSTVADLGQQIAELGSANIVTDQGYHRTAIKRDQPSLPLRHLRKHHPQLLQGRVLDFGSGRGTDCRSIRARCYDPHHPRQSVRATPTGKFDTVMMTYVANVLPKAERAKAVKKAARMVRKGGSVVISTRSKSDSGYQAAKTWKKHGDGYAKFTDQGTLQRFQRFYDGAGLRREMDAMMGSGFQRVQIRPIGGHTEVVAYRRIR